MTALAPRFLSALPVLVVPDVPAAVAFYRDVFGFRVPPEYAGDGEFAIVDRQPGQGVQLKRGAAAPRWRRQMGVYVLLGMVELEALATRLASAGADVLAPLDERPWGMRELSVVDLDGYLVRFGSDADGSFGGAAQVWPEVPVVDAPAASDFCRDHLGMRPAGDTPYFRRSQREGVTLNWIPAAPNPLVPSLLAAPNRARAGIWDVAVEVSGLDALAADLAVRGTPIQRGPVTTDYGMRELEITGPEGWTICFAEDLGD